MNVMLRTKTEPPAPIDGSSEDPVLELEKVSCQFSGHLAVDDVSLRIKRGEFITLLGPSGCGKTTILRMVAGFERNTSGVIRIAGKDMSGLPPYKRPVGIVFQNLALFPHMTISENIAFGLEVSKVARRDINRRVEEALELIGLPKLGGRRIHEISGGQRQRVALARAIVLRPDVLLLDEPLGALDLKIRRQLQIELKRIQKQTGTTFVFVTHDQDEALTMSDRIAIMSDGKVEHLGSAIEIYNSPKTAFVANFVGETNFLAGEILLRGSDLCIRLSELDAIIPVAQTGLPRGQAASLSIRPENVRLAALDDASSHSPLTGMVKAVVYAGTSVRYEIDCRGKNLVATAPSSPSEVPLFTVGQAVRFGWAPKDALVRLNQDWRIQ